MANLYDKIIGSGAGFPINLTRVVDEKGEPVKVFDKQGGLVDSISWKPLVGDIDLIKQNIISILNTQVGFSIRREEFGSRIMELIEERNNQALTFLASTYITDAISTYEKRVKVSNIYIAREFDKLYIKIILRLNQTNNEYSLDVNYDTINQNFNAN